MSCLQGAETGDASIKASIIVPCYNVEKYLPRCLDSLVGQTLEDIEIICVNDGSSDHCIDILRDYEARYPGKVVVIDKQNEGVWKGRRDAFAIARGEYIGFVDSDDYVAPDFAESLYVAAKESDADISVCGFHRVDVDSGEILTTEMTEPRAPIDVAQCPERLLELNGASWNKFFSAHLMKDLPDLPNPPCIFDDMMMHLLVFPQVKNIAFVDKPLVFYFIRNDSIMTTIDKSKIESTYQAMLDVRAVYDRLGALSRLGEFLDAAAFLHLGVSLMFRVSYDKTANLKQILAENTAYLDNRFPTWRTSDVISSANAKRFGGVFGRLNWAKRIYTLHLMGPALACYRFAISKLHIDIKW
ncbi:MAG TPA: glycosyltransferase [Candidatus Aphodovivens excrementavium]|nr:glycosyltransferase [Candidatus Aphodovivens excrementavium]